MKVTTQDYGQFLVNGVNNFTGTYFADTVLDLKHDSVWRHLNGSKLHSKAIWERVSKDIVYSDRGYMIFDDSVLDKSSSKHIELARRQYSGTEHDIVMGIGLVNCIYYNPDIDEYWIIDARIYQPDQDGKKKYEHLQDMLLKAIERGVKFRTVLMDTWYSIASIMCWIDGLGYKFVCPVRSNRQVLDHWTNPEKPKYNAVKLLPWEGNEELAEGKITKLKQCHLKLRLFQLTTHPRRTDYVVTNDHEAVSTSDDATKACAARWKIEQYHRESKQLTGIAKCQARNAKAQRKHIITAILAWIVLHAESKTKKLTIYAIKNEPLKQFQEKLWRNPYTVFT
jgi:hypothetical protein